METIHPLKGWMKVQEPPLSQADAARRLEVSEGYLSQVISGKRALSLKRAVAWSEITGLSPEAFLAPQSEAAQ